MMRYLLKNYINLYNKKTKFGHGSMFSFTTLSKTISPSKNTNINLNQHFISPNQIKFQEILIAKNFKNLFEILCKKSSILTNEELLFEKYFKEVKELIKQGKMNLIIDFYNSIIQNDNFKFKNKDYTFVIFEKSLLIFQNEENLKVLEIENLIRILQFYIFQKSYISNHFFFKLINNISDKMMKNTKISIESIVKIIEISRELRYLHFKLIDSCVSNFLKLKEIPTSDQLLRIIDGLTFFNFKPSLINLLKLPEIQSLIIKIDENLIKLKIIALLNLTKTINQELTMKFLSNCEKLNLTKSKEVSYLKFIIFLLKLNNNEFKNLDNLINLKYSHYRPYRICSHYHISCLDYFNFFKYYFKSFFLVNNPDFSLEIDYSIMDIFVIPFRIKNKDV